jgi:threonine aldolase
MRQAGILAAAGIHALTHNVSRLAEDHDNARLLQERLSGLPGIRVPAEPVETNILFIETVRQDHDATALNSSLRTHGIRLGVEGPTRLRAVTHLDVSRADIVRAAEAIAEHARHGS